MNSSQAKLLYDYTDVIKMWSIWNTNPFGIQTNLEYNQFGIQPIWNTNQFGMQNQAEVF
jgi:hypothetical protein